KIEKQTRNFFNPNNLSISGFKMNKQPVLNILKDIFQAYGYNIDSSYISDLVASKGVSDHIYIKLDSDVDYSSMRRFADSIKNTEGTGLYILNNRAPGEVAGFASQQDIIFWDKHDLESQIGKAILANTEGLPMKLDISPHEIQRITERPEPTPEAGTRDDSIFGLFAESPASKPEPVHEPAFKWPGLGTPPGQTHPESMGTGAFGVDQEEEIVRIPLPSMPINMAKTSAIKISQAKIGEVQDLLLKFIPNYIYKYEFDTKRKFRSKIIDLNGQGEGMVNAITGEHTFTRSPDILEYAEIITENYQIKEPTISDKDAKEKALDAIIRKHSNKMKVDEVKGDTIISESKTLSPLENEIDLAINIVYIPVWEIQGKQNTIDINAYDGHILETPVDDDAEFV
ncbi:MAG: hypothetical protein K8R34_06140, partial [Methanosarcinales archaeon]|nr:hypothetical protein [Methanosarcinales archaeon]